LAQLRSRAEQRASAAESTEIDTLDLVEARRLLHELSVHQIELEMQNSELRASQDQLEVSKKRYFDLYDLAPVGYLTLSEKGLILEANLTVAKALGVERVALPGLPLSRFILSNDQDIYYKHCRSLFTSGQPQNCELRFKQKDNAPFWARLESNLAEAEDGAPSWRLIVTDITKRKQAEEERNRALQQLELVTENMEPGVTRCSRDLRYLWVSRSYAGWLGRVREEIAGRSIVDVIGPEALETKRPHFERVLSGEREEYETELRVPKIGARLIHAVYLPTRDPDHKIDGWVGVVEDVTSERTAQKESFARQKLEAIGTIASGIAHDFNNLLGGVLAQAEMAQVGLDAGAAPQQELRTIREIAVRGSEIVRELMMYAGKERGSRGLVDVSRVVEEMLGLLRVSVSKHAALETDFGRDLPGVLGNSAQLRQIVLNLVINASEAIGDRDGVIRVSTRCVRVGRKSGVISGGLADGDYVQLEVSDTGSGMSAETQSKVFDPFFSTKWAGRGLGLAVVDGIVRSLHGTIQVESELGQGTRFEVLLPAAAEATAVAVSEPISSGVGELPGPARGYMVLVVEDEDALREAVVRALRKAGFAVLDAANGTAAIDLLRVNGNKTDLLLLDMTLPGASSHEVAAVAAEVRPDLKVVLTSAYGEDIARDMADVAQPCRFIRKPFQLGLLIQTLQDLLCPGVRSEAAFRAEG
jgi:PAS domain S-box-containing protein